MTEWKDILCAVSRHNNGYAWGTEPIYWGWGQAENKNCPGYPAKLD
jgi:hypothetical protein